MKSKNQKIILITGASSGIGMSSALRLIEKGAVVYAAARHVEKMNSLREKGARALYLDVTDEDSVRGVIDTIIEEQGRLDVLVNNAGYGEYGAVENVTMESARRQLDVNVFGLARLCQLALPYMRQKGDGRIINIASMAAHFCEPRGGWYHATKYAVEALSECMRMEVHRFGIKVILIEPGAIRTAWSDIAMNNMTAASEGTPYETGARKQAALFRWAYSHIASSPEKVAKRIVRAATSSCPRLRYRVGMGSHALPFLNTILPARVFDALMRFLFD